LSDLLFICCTTNLSSYELVMPIVVQEITSVPTVLCEPVDKKLTFQESEV
jgi:hypothetical protein